MNTNIIEQINDLIDKTNQQVISEEKRQQLRDSQELLMSNFSELKGSVPDIDFGEEIIMAHVLPAPAPKNNPIYLENVFQKTIEKATEYNLNLLNSKAIIHAGTREDMDLLKSGISQLRIPLKSASFSKSTHPSRTVFYDPLTNYLEIRKSNDQDNLDAHNVFEKEE